MSEIDVSKCEAYDKSGYATMERIEEYKKAYGYKVQFKFEQESEE